MQQSDTKQLRNLVKSGDLDAIQSFLQTVDKATVLQKDDDGRDALYDAIFVGNENIVNELVKFGFNPADIDNQTGATALHLAASEGNFDLIVYLTDIVKMDVNLLDKRGANPLYYAMMFLNQNNNPKEMVISPKHLDAAWLLVIHGAKFQPNMFNMQLELETLEHMLLQYIHEGMKDLDGEHAAHNLNFIQFISGAFDYYKLFLNDINKTLPECNLFDTDEFKKSNHEIPLVFGWKISEWEFNNPKDKHLVHLAKQDIIPQIYDLAKVSPLLVNLGLNPVNLVTLVDSFDLSIHQKFKPDSAKQINIICCDAGIYMPNNYFDDTVTTHDKKSAIQSIVDLSAEVDRRKKLSSKNLNKELPVFCYINDLSELATKDTLGDLQNILVHGCDTRVYVIAVTGNKLSPVMRANFQSVITFKTETKTESENLAGCDNAIDLELDEMLFASPFIQGSQPVHIKMEK